MFREGGLVEEGFPTVAASMRFLSRMDSLMSTEDCLRGVTFPTVTTFIEFLFCVASLMSNET